MERITYSKLGFARLWRDPSVKRLVVAIGIAIALAAALLWLYNRFTAEQLKQDWLDKEAAMIGTLSASHPELAEQWLKLLSEDNPPSGQTVEEGRRQMSQYGLTPRVEARWLPALDRYASRAAWLLVGGAVLLIACLGVFLLREYRRRLSEIRNLAVSLEDAVKHNLPMAFRIYGEGELGLLANGVQELSLRLRETIEQLHRDKSFLKDTVADISHQLKTPLASLMIYVDLLREGDIDASHAAEFLETCRRELDRMEWLTLTLLKLARLEADALEMSMQAIPLSGTVRKAIASISRLADDKRIAVEFAEPAADPDLPHDPRWLAEAIANLLKNAVEHSSPGSTVTIDLAHTPVFIRLHVQDQGPGIEDEHLPHIFKKFYRTAPGGSGVGLGLPLAKSIAERHGGFLSAAAGPEGGTIFSLTLPHRPFPADSASLTKL